MGKENWYLLNEPDAVDSPALLVYPDRIQENISEMIRIAGDSARLMPHVKTHKMPEVIRMHIQSGITRFKCATIAEAEMLAESGATTVLMAYQLNKAKALRFQQLVRRYPNTRFASLVDNEESARLINEIFQGSPVRASVYIDIDDGMHRTGMPPGQHVISFYAFLNSLPNVQCSGLHVYDGHLHVQDFDQRRQMTLDAFHPVEHIITEIKNAGYASPEVIAGGSPTFPIHAENREVICSPGTGILWDAGYARLLPEQHFNWAAVLLTRIISKPASGIITTDLGHKSVAAENPIDKRLAFLNLTDYQAFSQSEEHLVVKVEAADWNRLRVGDALYAVPYHICPTVALYDEATAIRAGNVTGQWEITARKKRISI